MARTVYSIRMYCTAGITSADGNVNILVPDGVRWVLRDIDVGETTGVNGNIMEVRNPEGGPLVFFQRTAASGLGLGTWRGRQIYEPGEVLTFNVIDGTWSVMASGYQLSLP